MGILKVGGSGWEGVPADTGSLESGDTVRCPLGERSPDRQELPGRLAPEDVQTGRGGEVGRKGEKKMEKKKKSLETHTHTLTH